MSGDPNLCAMIGNLMRRRTFLLGSGATAATVAACGGARPLAIDDATAEADYPPLGRIVEVDGLKVHAAEAGEGGPPVILLHGASVNLRDWTYGLLPWLAERRRVVAFDRPGFGYSERAGDGWTPVRQARHLAKAARALGIERPIVVGHSWGAAVALAWALEHPDDVTGVVSVSGATMPWGAAASVASALGIGRWGVDRYLARLSRNAENGAVDDFVRRAFVPQPVPPGYLAHVGAPLSLRARTIEANGEDLAQTHTALAAQSRRYGDIAVPVEVVHGDRDWLLSVERHVEGLVAAVPNGNAVVAPGVGHMAHHARPDLLEAAISRLSAAA